MLDGRPAGVRVPLEDEQRGPGRHLQQRGLRFDRRFGPQQLLAVVGREVVALAQDRVDGTGEVLVEEAGESSECVVGDLVGHRASIGQAQSFDAGAGCAELEVERPRDSGIGSCLLRTEHRGGRSEPPTTHVLGERGEVEA